MIGDTNFGLLLYPITMGPPIPRNECTLEIGNPGITLIIIIIIIIIIPENNGGEYLL